MIKKNILIIEKENEPLQIDVFAIQDWESFDKLIEFVKKYYNAHVIKEADGPGARRWILESNGKLFQLIHDDMSGNYFVALSKDSEELVYKIGRDLESRLNNIDESDSQVPS